MIQRPHRMDEGSQPVMRCKLVIAGRIMDDHCSSLGQGPCEDSCQFSIFSRDSTIQTARDWRNSPCAAGCDSRNIVSSLFVLRVNLNKLCPLFQVKHGRASSQWFINWSRFQQPTGKWPSRYQSMDVAADLTQVQGIIFFPTSSTIHCFHVLNFPDRFRCWCAG